MSMTNPTTVTSGDRSSGQQTSTGRGSSLTDLGPAPADVEGEVCDFCFDPITDADQEDALSACSACARALHYDCSLVTAARCRRR